MVVVSDEGFQYLVVEHHGEIYRYLVRITGRSTDADDLSQETFLRAFRAYASGSSAAMREPGCLRSRRT